LSAIFWDSMLFIYLLEGHPSFKPRAAYLLSRARERGDTLYTSHLVLGEVLTGAAKSPDPSKPAAVRAALDAMGFTYLPFNDRAVAPFSQLRAKHGLKIADSIHLACAAAAGIDLFLTGDLQLVGLHVPGIQFVADFNTQIL
jgi:uncharacterized protein